MRQADFRLLICVLIVAALAGHSWARDNVDRDSFLFGERPGLLGSRSLSGTIIDPLIDWPTFYGVQQTGMVNARFDCYGTLGKGFSRAPVDISEWPDVSFETPPGSNKEYLWGGSIWVGGIVGQDTLVSTGADGWSMAGMEFHPPKYPYEGSVTRFYCSADYSMRAEFSDTMTEGVGMDYFGRPHVPLNIKIANRCHAWHTEPYNSVIVYDLIVTNMGQQVIEDGYFGLYCDADAYRSHEPGLGWQDDVAGTIQGEGIAYIIDNDGEPSEGGSSFDSQSLMKIFAVKLLASSKNLTNTNFNWWVSNANGAYDFGPRQQGTVSDPFRDFQTGGLGTPEGDVNKYYLLSHQEWDYDQVYTSSIQSDDSVWLYPPETLADDLTDGFDTRFLISFGPVDLLPDSSVRILFATFTADSVHVAPDNLDNLPANPDQYLADLNFDEVLEHAAAAEMLADSILCPLNPVAGLEVAYQSGDSVVIGWDPWVFDGVEGYEVYLTEIPDSMLPYPGVPPPWVTPSELVKIASLGNENRFVIDALDPNEFYLVNVAQRTSTDVGSEGKSLIVSTRVRLPRPEVAKEYLFYLDGDSVELNWHEPGETNVDHYNVYKFEDTLEYMNRYHAFYDEGHNRDIIVPTDSFLAGGQTYYYYAMEVYAVVDSGITGYVDYPPSDEATYVVTAVDKYGFESEFSVGIQSFEIQPKSKDILLVSQSTVTPPLYTDFGTIRAFYENVLAGYDYDIYCVHDTVQGHQCGLYDSRCIRWQDFTPYRLVILDDDWYDKVLTPTYEGNFVKYLVSGGNLAYFGSLTGLNNFSLSTTPPAYRYQDHPFINRFFGIDSLFFCRFIHYVMPSPPPFIIDTLFGFTWAESVFGGFPDIAYDVAQFPFTLALQAAWPSNTAPTVSTFKVNDKGQVTHLYRSRYPATSWLESEPVGVKTVTDETVTYLFGFHLWYMEHDAARELIDYIIEGIPTGVSEPEPSILPDRISLRQNYPNPFNPATVISFDLPRAARVTLAIHNILGQRVETLIDGEFRPAGSHYVEWDGTDRHGRRVATGVYFYRLQAGSEIVTRKMLLLK